MKSIHAILAMMLMSTAAHAADPNGNFHIVGAGSVTCRQYTNATPEQLKYAETWWAGYMTSLNRSTKDTYDIMGKETPEHINAMLQEHCAANPTDLFAVAVHAVAEELYPGRTRKSPN